MRMDAALAAPCGTQRQILKLTKKDYEDVFVQACWLYYIWEKGNKRAHNYMELAQQQLNDAWCVRASHQIRDLDLRHRWLEAKYDGSPLPRVASAVRRHFAKEFQKSYPKGVPDPIPDTP